MTAVSAASTLAAQSFSRSPLPARGVTKTTWRARPRRVSDTPSSALAAVAAVTPGTISKSIPALRSASISSCARPKSMGSPPFSRTTTACLRAASTSLLFMKLCAVEWRPLRLPTRIFRARAARASVCGCTSASWKTSSARSRISAARSVSRSGAPGPAPTRYTLPIDHPRGHGLVGDFVDQDKGAGGAVQLVGIHEERLGEREGHVGDIVHRQSRGLRLPLQRVDIDARVERNELCFHAARGVLEYKAGGRQNRRSQGLGGEPADTCFDGLGRSRWSRRVGEHVAA